MQSRGKLRDRAGNKVREPCEALSDGFSNSFARFHGLVGISNALDEGIKGIWLTNWMRVMFDNNEKAVVVSGVLHSLDQVAQVCQNRGYRHFRLQGDVPVAGREEIVQAFKSCRGPPVATSGCSHEMLQPQCW